MMIFLCEEPFRQVVPFLLFPSLCINLHKHILKFHVVDKMQRLTLPSGAWASSVLRSWAFFHKKSKAIYNSSWFSYVNFF